MWPNVDRIEVSRIAESIAWQGKFADPYMIPTGPTAHNAPIYPFLLSLVYGLPAPDRVTARLEINIFQAKLFGKFFRRCLFRSTSDENEGKLDPFALYDGGRLKK